MYIEALNVDKYNNYVVTWGARFWRTGVIPSYYVDLTLVPCDDLVGALAGRWRPTLRDVRGAQLRRVPIELLAQIELSSIWHRGVYLGLTPMEKRTFHLDPAVRPATLMMANENVNGRFTIPDFVYALGSLGLNTPLTRIATPNAPQELILPPIPALQGFYAGSSSMWTLLASGLVDHGSEGAFSDATTAMDGPTLNLGLNKKLSRKDDWVRAASFYQFPEYRQAAANLFLNCPHEIEQKGPNYIWADIPALPNLAVTVRGVPLPLREGMNPFLGLVVDRVSYKLPFDQVVVLGQGKPKINAIKGDVVTGQPKATRRRRYVKDDMEILVPGGLKSNKQRTAPRMHRVVVAVGVDRISDPNLGEKDVVIGVVDKAQDKPQPTTPEIPVAIAGPGIPDNVNGMPEANIAGDPGATSPETPERERSYQDLGNVIEALASTTLKLGAELSYFAVESGGQFKIAGGIVGEYPIRETKTTLTRFAWVLFNPDVPRRVLVAEIRYHDRHYYVLDSEKHQEQIAIGVLYQRDTYAQISDDDLLAVLTASIRTRGVWQALNGREYRVERLLHYPEKSVARRLERVILRGDAETGVPPLPPQTASGLWGLRAPRAGTPPSGSPRGPGLPMPERRRAPRRQARNS